MGGTPTTDTTVRMRNALFCSMLMSPRVASSRNWTVSESRVSNSSIEAMSPARVSKRGRSPSPSPCWHSLLAKAMIRPSPSRLARTLASDLPWRPTERSRRRNARSRRLGAVVSPFRAPGRAPASKSKMRVERLSRSPDISSSRSARLSTSSSTTSRNIRVLVLPSPSPSSTRLRTAANARISWKRTVTR